MCTAAPRLAGRAVSHAARRKATSQSWLHDFGEADLIGGWAEVALDREFVASIERAGESLKLQGQGLSANQGLLKEGFISNARVTQIEAQMADYGVKLEERRSELARSEQRFVDASLRIKGMENEYRQQASDQLKVTQARLAEIQQEQRKTGDAAKRQVITAPASGEVTDLKVTVPGAALS